MKKFMKLFRRAVDLFFIAIIIMTTYAFIRIAIIIIKDFKEGCR